MKKWILNLGLTTLAVLPIVAIASCSSTTNEIPTLTTEVAKYKNPFTVNDSSKTMTTLTAIESINKGSNAEKLVALQKLVTLQLDNNNFTYVVEKASAGANDQTIDVMIKITEKANTTKIETIKLVINGFAQATSPLDIEAKKFQISVAASEAAKKLGAAAVIKQINAAEESTRLAELQKMTTVPEASEGFTVKVLTAQAGSTETTVDVTLSIVQTSDNKAVQVTFKITEFVALPTGDSLTEQAKLLIDQVVPDAKNTETPLQASTLITKETLDDYYAKITLSSGINYEFVSATPNPTELTALNVVLKVTSNVEGVTPITKDVKITGFTSPKTVLENKAKLIVDNTVIGDKNIETAEVASKAINADTLVNYYANVALGEGFSYAWKSNVVAGDTVKVTVSVSGQDPLAPAIEHTFTISGFKKAIEAEAERFAISKQTRNTNIKTRQVTFGINQQSVSQANKLTALNAIVTDFPEIGTGFSLTIGEATIAASPNTSVKVKLTINQTSDKAEKVVEFTITGLTAETPQEEIQRLADANLINGTVIPAKATETAAQAKNGITNVDTLGTYYSLKPLPKGLSYTFTSSAVTNDTVSIVASVTSSETGTEAVQKTFVISGFKTAALAALETEAEKLINQEAIANKKSETATQAKSTINNDTTLNMYYQKITTLSSQYGYRYGGKSEVDKEDPTTLNVTLRIRITATNQGILKVVKITGFAAAKPIEKEALKFQTALQIKTPETLSVGVISVINAIDDNQENKLAALKGYVDNFPEVGTEYILSIGRAVVDTTTPTSVNIPITISPKPVVPSGRNAEAPVTVIFTITGLTVGTAEQQLNTISTLLNNRTVIQDKNSQTAAAAQAAITIDSQLNLYYKNTPLPTGFSYYYGGKSEVDKQTTTTLNVTLRIVNTSAGANDLTIYKVVQISGFTALTPTPAQAEAQKFAISSPITVSGTLTSAVITALNNAGSNQEAKLTALKGYVSNFPDTAGFTLNIGTVKVDPTKDTSVMVPMTVVKDAVGSGQASPAVSVVFIITGLTVPTES